MNFGPMNAFMPTSASGTPYKRDDTRPRQSTAPTGPADLYRHATTDQNKDRLSGAIDRAVMAASAEFTEAEKAAVETARHEATETISVLVFDAMPWVGVTEDCTVICQWRRDTEGVVFSFSGHGSYGVAMKTGRNSHYSDNILEKRVGDALPLDIQAAVARLSRSGNVVDS